MDKKDIQKAAKSLASKFGRLKGEKFAQALMGRLEEEHVEGKFWTLKASGDSDKLIVVKGDDKAISDTGKHFGVEVEGIVYDNVFPKGLSLSKWKITYEADVALKPSSTSF